MELTFLYKIALWLIFGFAALVFVTLFFIPAPYGKFTRKGWGPSVRAKWGWMLMELPSPALMTYFYLTAPQRDLPQMIFIGLWLMHYLHRTFIYPFTQSGRNKDYPILLVAMAFVFNVFNGFVNGYGLFHYAIYSFSWIMTWQFLAGFILFITGFIINKKSDWRLSRLRKSNPGEYVIPQGGWFRFVSSPHFLGEIIEWGGWAVITLSTPGLAFALFTFANLFPRAIASHKWYRERFPHYPAKRKAIIPFIV